MKINRALRTGIGIVVLWAGMSASCKDSDIPGASAPPVVRDAGPAEGENGRGAPKPPSTGKEMPAPKRTGMTPAQAKEALAAVDRELSKPGPSCDHVATALIAAIPVIAPKANKDNLRYYQALQRCASETKRWKTVVRATVAMLPLGAPSAGPEHLVRALVEMGEFDRASAALNELANKMPDGKAGLLAARSYLLCKKSDWKLCLSSIDQGLTVIQQDDPELKSAAAFRIQTFRGLALTFLGDLDEAEKAVDALESHPLLRKRGPEAVANLKRIEKPVRKKIAEARATGLVWDVVAQPEIALGAYHLFGTEETGAPVALFLYNLRDTARQLRITTSLQSVSEPLIKTVTLLPHAQREALYLVPPLAASFDTASLRSARPIQASIKIEEVTDSGSKVVYDDALRVKLLPRDHLPLFRAIGADMNKTTFEYMAAWVTPNARRVEQFLTAAKARQPQKMFVGEQAETFTQVQALFDELKSRGVSYVTDPTINTDLGHVQRTRLPAEVLASTNAQCLEGTLLFASLLEAIGLRPIIVMVPGHAFVGWHTTTADPTKGKQPLFVETTMIGNADFKTAVKAAMRRVSSETKLGNFKNGTSSMIELTDLRAKGYGPQPTE